METQPLRPATPTSPSRRPWLWILAIPVALALVVAAAAFTGFQAGRIEVAQRATQEATAASQEQFDLGVQDILAGRFELARRRFEYILSLDPSYPGAAELLAEALQALNVPTATPSPTPVPATPTATLDLSSLDGLFAQAQASFSNGDWSGALHALLAMRVEDPAYRLSEVNALMGATLRSRGVQKILQGFLEQGIYDLDLAERFGALDAQALSWRNTAEFYLVANSYFGLDWPRAAEYFRQLCAGQTWDSCRKYAVAALNYGNLLLATQDVCGAMAQYQASLNLLANSTLDPTATIAAERCLTATAVPPTLTSTPTLTPTLIGPTPSDTPTAPLVPTDTPTPSATPTPIATETTG
ncbi:MAG: hypothetical protein AB1449_09495 [Chloroflexota bacterium]